MGTARSAEGSGADTGQIFGLDAKKREGGGDAVIREVHLVVVAQGLTQAADAEAAGNDRARIADLAQLAPESNDAG